MLTMDKNHRKLSGQIESKLQIETDENFGVPNSPTKIRKCMTLVQRRRNTTQNYRELTVPLVVEDVNMKHQQFDPIILEERYIRATNTHQY